MKDQIINHSKLIKVQALVEKFDIKEIKSLSLRTYLQLNLLDKIKEKESQSIENSSVSLAKINYEIYFIYLKIILASHLSNFDFFNKMENGQECIYLHRLLDHNIDQKLFIDFICPNNDFLKKVSESFGIELGTIKDQSIKDEKKNSSFIDWLKPKFLRFDEDQTDDVFVRKVIRLTIKELFPNLSEKTRTLMLQRLYELLLKFALTLISIQQKVCKFLGLNLDFLQKEATDLIKNKQENTILDRLIRIFPICMLYFFNIELHIASRVFINPFWFPIIYPFLVMGGLILSFSLLDRSLKLAKTLSKKLHKVVFGVTNPSYYQLSEKGKELLGRNNENISKLIELFKKHIQLCNYRSDLLHENPSNPKYTEQLLEEENILTDLQNAFILFKEGSYTKGEGENILKKAIKHIIDIELKMLNDIILGEQEKLLCTNFEFITKIKKSEKEITVNDLLIIIEKQLSNYPHTKEKMEKANSKLKQATQDFDNCMLDLLKIHDIIENTANTSSNTTNPTSDLKHPNEQQKANELLFNKTPTPTTPNKDPARSCHPTMAMR